MQTITSYPELFCYESDNSKIKGIAEKVIFPTSTQEVQQIVRQNTNLTIRGSGTNKVGGAVPFNSIVVAMKKMNRVSTENKTSDVIIAESGTTNKELQEKVQSINREFPIYDNNSTLGGMIALNKIGFYNSYGPISRYIQEIELINGKGEIVTIRISDLFDICGLEGTTGIITKCKLKLIPSTKKTFSLFQSNNLDEIFEIIKGIKHDKEIISLWLFSPALSSIQSFPEVFHLIIAFKSERGKIKNGDSQNLINRIQDIDQHLNREGFPDWEDPHFVFESLFDISLYLFRLKVPFQIDLSNNRALIYLKNNDPKKDDILKMIKRLSGKPGTKGIGIIRKDILDFNQLQIFKRIKMRYDPFNKCNNRVLVDINQELKIKDKEQLSKPNKSITSEKKVISPTEKKQANYPPSNIKLLPPAQKQPMNKIIEPSDKDLINKIMFNKRETKEENGTRDTQPKK